MGRPGQTQLINSHNQFGGSQITRTTDITWDTTACRPTQIVEESGNAQLQVTRALGYDGFGNVNSETVTGIGMTPRQTTANWGTTGQFSTSVTNALMQTTNKTWNYAFGTQTSETDPNGITVGFSYDDFGRLSRENRPDGTAVTHTYNACAAPNYCGYSTLRYYIETSLLNTAAAVVRNDQQYFDVLDRLRFDEPLLVTGSRVVTEIQYDAFGRVAKRSAPRFPAGALYWNEFQYDLLNRITQASRPTSDTIPTLATTTSYYEGLTMRVVDTLGKQSTKVANVVGAAARSIDHDGYFQALDYDAFGNVVSVTDSLSNTLQSNTFNIRGMRTAHADMHGGNSSFYAERAPRDHGADRCEEPEHDVRLRPARTNDIARRARRHFDLHIRNVCDGEEHRSARGHVRPGLFGGLHLRQYRSPAAAIDHFGCDIRF